MTLAVFAKRWSLARAVMLKYSLDGDWPEKNLIRHRRNAASALQGLVHMALWKLGTACERGIRPEKFILSFAEPTPKMFAYLGPAVEGANRDRTRRRKLLFYYRAPPPLMIHRG